MNTTNKKVRLRISELVAGIYIVLSVVLVPWTIYLAINLPSRHLSRHWDFAWVGLDVGIIIFLLTTGILTVMRSRWLVITASITGSLLLVDAWFDIVSARPGAQLRQAVILAFVFELPVAVISFRMAAKVLRYDTK